MARDRINWINDSAPYIDADNLNKIERALDDLYNERVINVDTTGASGSGIIARFGPSCMMALTFVNPIAIGGSTDILQFPLDFKPYLDFTAIVFDETTGSQIGAVFYKASTNILTFVTSSQDANMCKVSVTYITDITAVGPSPTVT